MDFTKNLINIELYLQEGRHCFPVQDSSYDHWIVAAEDIRTGADWSSKKEFSTKEEAQQFIWDIADGFHSDEDEWDYLGLSYAKGRVPEINLMDDEERNHYRI